MKQLNTFKTIYNTIGVIFLSLFSFQMNAASYSVQLDYQHNSIKHTDTKSNITLSYFNQTGDLLHKETVKGVYPISKTMKTFRFSSEADIFYISIETNGEDAFFIDKVIIKKDNQIIQEHGTDGGKGWCMSTDPGDSRGIWANFLEDDCQATRIFIVNKQLTTPTIFGKQKTRKDLPTRRPKDSDKDWVYLDNEQRREINAEGLGRCYDVRYIDPINWSNETLKSGQRASVISLIRDDSKRPARHNNKDYVVPKGVVFTSEIIGDSEAESKFAATSYEYENEVLREYRAGVGVPKAGSAKASVAFNNINSSSGSHSSLYAFSKMYKQFYKLDLYFDDPSHQHFIDQRFWNGVKDLGHDLSAIEFINKFGTHYASSTYYGGNFFQRRTISQSEYAFYEASQSEFKVDVAGTIKKVNFDIGTTQGFRNRNGETEQVKMSSAKIFTIGGDLNQYRPDLWSKSVLKNLAVVKVKLTRISDLLTSENFPEIPNIEDKRKLLEATILTVEKEAEYNQSLIEKHSFFTKKAATYRLTVSYLKCKAHGQNEAGGNSEYFGNIKMAFFNKNDKALKTVTCFNKDQKNAIDLTINQTHDINKKVSLKISPADITKGYISVYGSLKEMDFAEIPLSNISKYDSKSKIYFRDALDHKVTKKVTFTSKYGDKVEAHFKLERL